MGYGIPCDEKANKKSIIVTHFLRTMGWEMRLSCHKKWHPNSHTFAHVMRWQGRKVGMVTHITLEWDAMGQGGRKRVDCYSLAVGNGMRCDQTHVPKTEGNVTHILLVVGGLMRLLGRKKGHYHYHWHSVGHARCIMIVACLGDKLTLSLTPWCRWCNEV